MKSCTSHQFTPYANWSVTKRCFHHFGGSLSFERGTVRKLHAGLGLGQIWRACNSRLMKNSASHLFWLVQTCPNLSEPVRNTVTMYACGAMSFIFLHFRMFLFFSITSYPAEIAHFNSPNRDLSNFVRLMELCWSKIVDPSRSPCLKPVQRKSFEWGNFF